MISKNDFWQVVQEPDDFERVANRRAWDSGVVGLDAQDLIQDTHRRIWQAYCNNPQLLERLKDPQESQVYFFTTLRSSIRDYIRRANNRVKTVPLPEGFDPAAEDQFSVADIVDARSIIPQVRAELSTKQGLSALEIELSGDGAVGLARRHHVVRRSGDRWRRIGGPLMYAAAERVLGRDFGREAPIEFLRAAENYRCGEFLEDEAPTLKLGDMSYRRRLNCLSPKGCRMVFLFEGCTPAQEIVEDFAWRRHTGPARSLAPGELHVAKKEFVCLLPEVRQILDVYPEEALSLGESPGQDAQEALGDGRLA